MEITDIKFRHFHTDGKLKALVSLTFDNSFAVHDIKIIEGNDRLFLAMPSRLMPDGKYRDIVHPVGQKMREYLEKAVLTEYDKQIFWTQSKTVISTALLFYIITSSEYSFENVYPFSFI